MRGRLNWLEEYSGRHFVFFFFFQAEDGIRDVAVTGVQTCALPILLCAIGSSTGTEDQRSTSRSGNKKDTGIMPTMEEECPLTRSFLPRAFGSALKRRRQRRSLIRTALGPPKCSSSEVKSRPSAGAIPQTCKNRDAT